MCERETVQAPGCSKSNAAVKRFGHWRAQHRFLELWRAWVTTPSIHTKVVRNRAVAGGAGGVHAARHTMLQMAVCLQGRWSGGARRGDRDGINGQSGGPTLFLTLHGCPYRDRL